MVKISEFTNGKGKQIQYLEIEGYKDYPVRVGIQKAKAVLANAKDIQSVLAKL